MAEERDSGSGEYLDDEPTNVVARPLSCAPGAEDERPLYPRLVEALQLSASATELLVCDLLRHVGATPNRLSPAQLWEMRTGLFELVDGVLPTSTREKARTSLLTLLLTVAPLRPSGG
jgi:hypothetical protein